MAIIRKHLPRWKISSVLQLSDQITAIDRGLRTAFLFERSVDVVHINELIRDLLSTKEITREIQVIQLEMEVFLINRDLLLEHLQQTNRFVFVNLANLETIDRQEKEIRSLYNILKENQELKFPHDDSICLPAITGLLLDYPTIYYFDPRDELPLGSETLTVYQVFHAETLLYKFSVPNVLLKHNESSVAKHVHQWQNSIQPLGLRVDQFVETVDSWVL